MMNETGALPLLVTAISDDVSRLRAGLAGSSGMTVDEVADCPLFLTGSPAELRDRLEKRREETGISYSVIQGQDLGVGGGVAGQLTFVVASGDHLAVDQDHRTDGDVGVVGRQSGLVDGDLHGVVIAHRLSRRRVVAAHLPELPDEPVPDGVFPSSSVAARRSAAPGGLR